MLKGARNGKLSKSKDLNGSQREQEILDWVTNAFKMLLSKNKIKNTEASRNVNLSLHIIFEYPTMVKVLHGIWRMKLLFE